MSNNKQQAVAVEILSPEDGMTGSLGKYLVKGTATAQSEVVLKINNRKLTTLKANKKGQWAVMVNFKKPGSHTVRAYAADIPEDEVSVLVNMIAQNTDGGSRSDESTETARRDAALISATSAGVAATDHPAVDDITIVEGHPLSYRPDDTQKTVDEGAIRKHYNWKWLALALLLLLLLVPFLLRSYVPGMEGLLSGLPGMGNTPTVSLPDGPIEVGELGLSGTGTPGGTLELVLDDNTAATTIVSESGRWAQNLTFSEAGDYQLVANMIDGDGEIAHSSDPVTVNVVDALTSAASESTDAALAEPTDELAEEPTEEKVEEVTEERAEEVTEEQTDGSTEEPSATGDSIEEVAEEATEETEPEETEPEEAESESTGSLTEEADDGSQSAGPPTIDLPDSPVSVGPVDITGAASAGMIVELVVDGDAGGSAETDENGRWQITENFFEIGDYSLVANIYNDAGIIVATSDGYMLSVLDLAQSGAGDSPEDDEAGSDEAGSGNSNSIVTIRIPAEPIGAGTFVADGTAPLSSTVNIMLDAQMIAAAVPDGNGRWATPITVTTPGTYVMQASALDPQGEVLGNSELSILTLVDDAANDDTASDDAVGNNTADDDAASEAEQPDTSDSREPTNSGSEPAVEAPSALSRPTIAVAPSSDGSNLITFSGTAEPNTQLTIYLDRQSLIAFTVGGDGTWQYSTQIAIGEHDAFVNSSATDGRIGSSSTLVEFTVDADATDE